MAQQGMHDAAIVEDAEPELQINDYLLLKKRLMTSVECNCVE